MGTINLSQMSELALVIASIGMSPELGHVDIETLTVLIWAFAILGIASSYVFPHSYRIWGMLHRNVYKLFFRKVKAGGDTVEEIEEEDHKDRDIILLGFHKIAAMLITHL